TEYAVIIENKKPIGIVTLKDLMNALKKEMDFDKTDVRNFMSTSLISMNPGTSIYKGFKIALERRFNQIPIIDMHKVVVGIVNVKYLVRVYYEFVASLNEEDRAKFLKEVDSNNNYNDNLAGT
ncbi:CBS domain-containing protein, partial [Candidatus Pacearchaeota archaeon]|nr:CBS domain-containing protein [Candidatus Pacearchaeota archaeon]